MPKPRKAQAISGSNSAAPPKKKADAEKVLSTLSAELRALVELGRKRGYVTYDEIQETVPEVEHNLDEYDRIYGMLVDLEINPLIVRAAGAGAITVDARGTLDAKPEGKRGTLRGCPYPEELAP